MTFWTAAPKNSKNPNTLPQYKSESWGWPAILILGLFMATISWQKWANLIVDYGTQLYTPWQISEGAVLYKDVDYLFGPLSTHLHALLFKIFGPGIMVLAWFNIGLVVALVFLIYLLFKYFSDSLTGTLAALTFLGVFSFGQYMGGNYNFICSYAYELPHGVFLSFLILWIFTQTLERPSRYKLILIGFLTGLVYLTKPEVFLSIATALVVGLYFLFKKQTLPKNSFWFLLGSFLTAPILTTIYFSTQVSLSQALSYIFLPWFHVFGSPISSLPMYRLLMGTKFLAVNIWSMFSYFFLIIGFCLTVISIGQWMERFSKRAYFAGCGILILVASSVVFWYYAIPIFEFPRSLPLIVLVFSIFLFLKILKPANGGSSRTLGLLVFSIFSLVLMLKMIFHVRVNHYGFALALPATLVLIHILTHEFPKWLSKYAKPQNIFRPGAIAIVVVFIGIHIHFEYKMYSNRGEAVGKGSDTILDFYPFVTHRGIIFNAAIEFVEKEIPEEDEITTIPGSILLNYMTRKKSSLKYIYLDPGALQIIGNYQIYGDLQKNPPPYIIFMDQKFSDQGAANFGKDFGKHIFQWIHENYFVLRQYGAQPFVSDKFGIQILKRKSPHPEQ